MLESKRDQLSVIVGSYLVMTLSIFNLDGEPQIEIHWNNYKSWSKKVI